MVVYNLMLQNCMFNVDQRRRFVQPTIKHQALYGHFLHGRFGLVLGESYRRRLWDRRGRAESGDSDVGCGTAEGGDGLATRGVGATRRVIIRGLSVRVGSEGLAGSAGAGDVDRLHGKVRRAAVLKRVLSEINGCSSRCFSERFHGCRKCDINQITIERKLTQAAPYERIRGPLMCVPVEGTGGRECTCGQKHSI